MSKPALNIFEKIWAQHTVADRSDGQVLLYVDRQFIHDGYAPAFDALEKRGLPVRHPWRNIATADHYIPTDSRDTATITDPERKAMVTSQQRFVEKYGLTYFPLADARQGIVHVIGPEQGISQPGMTIICGDSHTSTHGALGALAFGVGMTEASYALATQAIWQQKPKTMRVWVDGVLATGVTAKDLVLAIIGQIGAGGATGHVVEYAGPAISALSVEGRLTVCNMSIEAGAKAGLIAPDETTYAYLEGRPYAPKGSDWDAALARWRQLPSDAGAQFDREVRIDGSAIAPMVTWGTSPEDVTSIAGLVPDPADEADPDRRAGMERALRYMDLIPGTRLQDVTVDRVFIGSCTNGRIEDLRAAADVVRGRRVAASVEAWIVPGSTQTRLHAEAEGLDKIFLDAGFQWRQAGCSLCLGTNGETVASGQRCASTSNRNFVGRQGRGARTHLMSPAMAAAAAVTGRLADVRQPLGERLA